MFLKAPKSTSDMSLRQDFGCPRVLYRRDWKPIAVESFEHYFVRVLLLENVILEDIEVLEMCSIEYHQTLQMGYINSKDLKFN